MDACDLQNSNDCQNTMSSVYLTLIFNFDLLDKLFHRFWNLNKTLAKYELVPKDSDNQNLCLNLLNLKYDAVAELTVCNGQLILTSEISTASV